MIEKNLSSSLKEKTRLFVSPGFFYFPINFDSYAVTFKEISEDREHYICLIFTGASL
jgi:hypothetical protein